MLSLILLVFALVLFIIAGFVNPVDPWRGKLLCFGLACMAGAEIAVHAAPLLR
jgi:ABC-type transport system involved in multi-copper enzyme maturation permease subunit